MKSGAKPGSCRRRLLVLMIAAAALPACGQSTPSPSSPPTGGGAVQSATVAATASNTFSPSTVNLLQGGTVTFVNEGGLHNVNGGFFRCAADDCIGSGNPNEDNWNFTITFSTIGTVNYVCDEHVASGMSGRVIVQ